MATFRRFEQLEIWQKARAFANQIYGYSTQGNFARDFALRDQINRSGGSIMDNIAEGFERGGTNEFVMFLSYAKGSSGEARSQIYRAYDRKYIDESSFNTLQAETLDISKGISGFMAYLKSSSIKGTRFRKPQEDHQPDLQGEENT